MVRGKGRRAYHRGRSHERTVGLLRCFTGRRDGGLPPKPSYLDAPPEISPFPRFSLIELVFELKAFRDVYSRRRG